MNHALVCLACVGFALMVSASADEAPTSEARLSAGADNADGRFGRLALDLGLPNQDRLHGSASSSRIESRSQSEESSPSRRFEVGYTLNPEEDWAFDIGAEVWGAKSELSSRSLWLDVTRNFIDWSVGIQPESKTLKWVTTQSRQVRTRAFGLHAHVDYFGFRNWQFGLNAGSYNYGGQEFEDFLYSYLISDSAFALSSGLVKSYWSTSASFTKAPLTYRLSLQNSTYVVEGVKSKGLGFDLEWAVTSNWGLGYNLNTSKTENSPSVTAHSLEVSFAW